MSFALADVWILTGGEFLALSRSGFSVAEFCDGLMTMMSTLILD